MAGMNGQLASTRRLRLAPWLLAASACAGLAAWAQERPAPESPSPAPGTPARAYRPPPGARITDDGWFAKRTPGKPLPELPKTVARVFVFPVQEAISPKTFDAMKRKAVRWASSADVIVLDMDTWGGSLGAALDISRFLKSDMGGIYKVCYVRTRAVSAGAMIALACDEIVMTPVGTFGDCAPIMAVPNVKLEGVEREKIETVTRNDLADSAERNGYSVAMAKAMVTIGQEVWLIRHEQSGELRCVDAREWRGRVSAAPGATTAPTDPQAEWELLRTVDGPEELLTLNSRQALEYGFASAIIDSPADKPYAGLMAHLKAVGLPRVVEDTWSERLVEFLLSTPVMTLLFFLGVLCAYVEMHTPGFGVAGTVAILCFALLFGSRYLVGLAAWWEIALFVVGLAMLIIEIFVTPGFGVLGVAGILCCVTALLAMLVANPPDRLPIPRTGFDWDLFNRGLLAMSAGIACAIAAAALLARHLPKVPLAGKLVLSPPEPAAVAGGPSGEGAPIRSVQVGAVGVVEGICRPVGMVRFGEHLVDAVADGAFIPAGTKVKVIKNEGNRVVVVPV